MDFPFIPVKPEQLLKTMRVMKITALILLIACLHVSARSHSQNVTLTAEHMPLKEVLQAIKNQTGYAIFYKKGALDQTRPVTLQVSNLPLAEFLDKVLQEQPLRYELTFKTITLFPKPIAPPAAAAAEKEEPLFLDISGTVTGENDAPLSGASVKIKGTSLGASTDAKGHFSIKAEPGQVLVISFIGYQSTQVKVAAATTLTIRLQLAELALDVITVNKGYYTEQRRLSAGNVYTVKSEDIARQPVSNVLSAIQGRVPGLIITQSTGVPGSAFTVQLRGRNSLNRSIATANDPLFVVDGIPYPSKLALTINSGDITNGGSPLNFINPQDIETIDILKDADATAIYGARASNGVILITTKKGKAGRTLISANVIQGAGKVTRMMKLLSTRQYLDMRYEAFKNDGVDFTSPTFYYASDLKNFDTTRYTDWQKEFLGGNAAYTDAQLSMSGGNTNTQYLIDGSYHRETTVFPGKALDQRGTLFFNISGNSNNQKLRVLLSGTYVAGKNDMPRYDMIDLALSLPPIAPRLYNDDGSLNWQNNSWVNPIARFRDKFWRKANNFIGNMVISYQLLPGLDLRTTLGYTHLQTDEMSNFPIAAYSPAYNITSGSAEFSHANSQTWVVEPQVNYSKELWKGRLNALAGTTIQQNSADGQDVNATGFISDALLGNLYSASTVTPMKSVESSYKYNSLFGRVNYTLLDRYVVNLTARRDGSDRFGPNRRFGNFGAAGIAWIFSRENFVADHLPFISFGKLRGSYGITGSDAIGDNQFIRTYSVGGLPYQGVRGLAPNNLFNPDYQWESNRKLEGGLELGFLKDKILVTASYYRNRSSNQLVGSKLPAITGFGSITANWPALVQNKGWEFTLNGNAIHLGPVTWNGLFQISIARNKLVAYPGLENTPDKSFYVVGQSVSIQKVYHSLGVDPATGIFQFLDKSGKTVTTVNDPLDRTVNMVTTPKYYGGFQNNFSYKGLELDVLFQFVKQTGIRYRGSVIPGYSGGMTGQQPVTVLDRWQQPNDVKPYERFNSNNSLSWSEYYFKQSDRIYTDASYIRLKNVQLSYDLLRAFHAKMGLQQLRVYIQAQNLLTITKFQGMDPENQSGTSLPPLRVIAAGIRAAL